MAERELLVLAQRLNDGRRARFDFPVLCGAFDLNWTALAAVVVQGGSDGVVDWVKVA